MFVIMKANVIHSTLISLHFPTFCSSWRDLLKSTFSTRPRKRFKKTGAPGPGRGYKHFSNWRKEKITASSLDSTAAKAMELVLFCLKSATVSTLSILVLTWNTAANCSQTLLTLKHLPARKPDMVCSSWWYCTPLYCPVHACRTLS